MDYRDESEKTSEIRWNDRVTYDGTWENNLFNFFVKVTPKLTADLKKPFRLENGERIDDTPVHKAIREGFVNLIIHSDYLLEAGTLKIIKLAEGYEFTNPGILKLPIDEIFKGGNSKSRNPRMQTMLRMVGFGDNAGSGFPTILSAWRTQDWAEPELYENTTLNQVTLRLKMIPKWKESLVQLSNWVSENANEATENLKLLKDILNLEELDAITSEVKLENVLEYLVIRTKDRVNVSTAGIVSALEEVGNSIASMDLEYDGMVGFLKLLAERLSESAEKSSESVDKLSDTRNQISDRKKQILNVMDIGKEYSAEEVATLIGLKGPRTRQLLNELVSMDKVKVTAMTKGRRYIRV